jgi:nucleoside-diphosphate-sugar epimerase
MKVLIVGGTRYFGRTFVENLVAEGHSVTTLSRGNVPAPAGAEALKADRTDARALVEAVSGRSFDVVVDNVAFTAADVRGALAAFAGRMNHYVFVSTVSVYADFMAGKVWHEADMGREALSDLPESLNPYARGKREAESVLFGGESYVPFTILRPGVVTGPHDYTRRLYMLIQRVLDGGDVLVPAGLPATMHFTWYADMARAMRRVLLAPETYGRAYNVVGDDVFTYESLVKAIAQAAGNASTGVPVPASWLETLEGYDLPFGSDGSTVLVNTGRQRDELGLTPTSAKVWLPDLVEFHRTATGVPDSAGYGGRARELALLAEARARYAAFATVPTP